MNRFLPRDFKRLFKGERGAALILTLAVSSILTMYLGAMFIYMSLKNTKVSH